MNGDNQVSKIDSCSIEELTIETFVGQHFSCEFIGNLNIKTNQLVSEFHITKPKCSINSISCATKLVPLCKAKLLCALNTQEPRDYRKSRINKVFFFIYLYF